MAGEIGYQGGKSIFDDYVRETRPRLVVPRTFQRTIYRPGELVQCDLWEPRELVAVGHGQHRRGWVLTCEVCWSRVIAGTLVLGRRRRISSGALPGTWRGSGRCRRGALRSFSDTPLPNPLCEIQHNGFGWGARGNEAIERPPTRLWPTQSGQGQRPWPGGVQGAGRCLRGARVRCAGGDRPGQSARSSRARSGSSSCAR